MMRLQLDATSIRVGRALTVAVAVLLSQAATAHHSHANLDRSNLRLLSGVVSEYSWSMPHVYLKVMAPNQRGEVVEYSVEVLHPPGMSERGWSRDSFSPGDRITWEGAGDRDPNRYYTGLNWVEKADGTRLTMRREEFTVEPSTDFTGLWVRSLGGATPDYAPPVDWPYTPLAQSAVDNFDETQNPQVDCMNPGPPKSTLLPYPIKISRPDDWTVVMEYELREEVRRISFDASSEVGEPSKLGNSVARLEGDVLIIETTNFIADRWGIQTGVDSSDQKHLVERFTLSSDGLAFDLEMTVTDPVYLEEPVVIARRYTKLPDRNLIYAECTMDSAQLYIQAGF